VHEHVLSVTPQTCCVWPAPVTTCTDIIRLSALSTWVTVEWPYIDDDYKFSCRVQRQSA